MLRTLTIALSIMLLCASLCSCVSLSLPSGTNISSIIPHTIRAKRLGQIEKWRAQGAFSIQIKNKAQIANFTWEQNDKSNFHIHISSSLNLYVLDIRSKGGRVSLNDGKHPPQYARSPEQLMQKAIGYSLPIQNLYYWARAIPAPSQHIAHYDSYGHLKQLRQQGWTIQYSHYQSIQHVGLPQMLNISRPDIKIRLVIKQWKLT